MAHFRKAYFDQGIGTDPVAADTDEKQTVHCANEVGVRKNNPECCLLLALVPYRSVLAGLCLKNDTI